MPPCADADTIRILVATDNHVGFEERDPIRKDDSWRTFDEIMQLAKAQDVDMVLLGGDLFHHNKPSRKAMYHVMRSLRKNCLGMKPCELEFLSDATEVFEGALSHVNYEDPDINISIPVFSIHGNHDDPSGDGHLCSLDLLQVAGLLNYFGRVPEADNVHVRPVLLQKGKTKLALYGISNIRDERMHRSFRDNKVRFYRPSQQQANFFNLLALHQNHIAHTATSYLLENMIPDFMDLIVWGHEHECLIDPRRNPETGFHVMQPGSSVATSLVPGEAEPKHVAVVSVTGRDLEVRKIPLKTVRPLVTREIVLAADRRFKGVDKQKDNRQVVTGKLMEIVDEMIDEANAQWDSVQDHEATSERAEELERPLPLIRLKVDYTALEGGHYDIENPQRFSNRFAGKLANTKDVVYYHQKKHGVKNRGKNGAVGTEGLPEDVAEAIEAMDTIRVDVLVQEYLAQQSLRVLPQVPFSKAVNDYVHKEDKQALEDFVLMSLQEQVRELKQLGDTSKDIEEDMDKVRKQEEEKHVRGEGKRKRRVIKEKPLGWDSDLNGPWIDQLGAVEEAAEPTEAEQPRGRGGRQRTTRAVSPIDSEKHDNPGRAAQPSMDEMEVDDAEGRLQKGARSRRRTNTTGPAASRTSRAAASSKKTAAASKTAAPKKVPAARGRKKPGPFVESQEEEADVVIDEDDDGDSDEVMPSPPPPPPSLPAKRTTRQSQASAAARTRQTTLNFSQSQTQRPKPTSQKPKPQKAIEISDDEISDDGFEAMQTRTTTRRGR